MAHTAPILLALLINFCGIFIFRSLGKVTYAPTSTHLASVIFTLGTFFLLSNVKIYPPTYRKSHWAIRSFIEFILAAYTFETCLCDFWFPLETFSFTILGKFAYYLKKYSPRSGILLFICCKIFEVITNNKSPILLSYGLAIFFLLFILHGTRTLDFRILLSCGPAEFGEHVVGRITRGVKSLIRMLPFLSTYGFNVPGKKCGTCTRRPRSCS